MCEHAPESCLLVVKNFMSTYTVEAWLQSSVRDVSPAGGVGILFPMGGVQIFGSFDPLSVSVERVLQRWILARCIDRRSHSDCVLLPVPLFVETQKAVLCLQFFVCGEIQMQKRENTSTKKVVKGFYVLGINLQQQAGFPERYNVPSTVELCTF